VTNHFGNVYGCDLFYYETFLMYLALKNDYYTEYEKIRFFMGKLVVFYLNDFSALCGCILFLMNVGIIIH